ncbi:MAG: AAA family ATPase [Acidimicrobiales bacterium]
MSGLASVGYLADERTVRTVWFADHLDRPILVEGPAGVGKTELAKSLAAVMPSRLIRLQCYEGLDEAKALYEWNYKKQLLRIQAEQSGGSWEEVEADVFTPKFLLTRPLLEAIRAEDPVVLLIDEVDRVEVETEALMLEVLSEFQVSIPELGTVTSTQRPLVLLTSNNTRQLSEALKRRCVYLSITYPTVEREKAILERRVPGISAHLADQAARHVAQLRALPLRKVPSISESIDWARTLVRLAVEVIDRDVMEDTMTLLLKYEGDLARAAEAQA